jgi:hypothetical protein
MTSFHQLRQQPFSEFGGGVPQRVFGRDAATQIAVSLDTNFLIQIESKTMRQADGLQ